MGNSDPTLGHHGVFPFIRNGAMSTIGRYLISFALGGLSAAFFLGGKSRDVNDLIEWKGHMSNLSNEWKGHVDTVLERIDRDGSNASRWRNEQEGARIQAIEVKTEELQKKMEAL